MALFAEIIIRNAIVHAVLSDLSYLQMHSGCLIILMSIDTDWTLFSAEILYNW